jgi:hypothetical protein
MGCTSLCNAANNAITTAPPATIHAMATPHRRTSTTPSMRPEPTCQAGSVVAF